ncbi:MAG: TM2 domain-containing protein [Bacteroidetes bacterium]|nr:TM2 domain-containing protein [Bacteroidota bacterium]MBU1116718.1 TM2 domain-containing protein [Bacteroidota bacterium]MBU1799834.1 TM2 domain-containing protein [Bacteroidota bacterium]
MANVLEYLPELMGEEQAYVAGIIREMDNEKAQQFAHAYRARRKDPQTILLVALVGFLGLAGIQRFLVDQIGMGILYLLTGGLCAIGTIVDMINHKKIAFEYNMVQAQQIMNVIR